MKRKERKKERQKGKKDEKDKKWFKIDHTGSVSFDNVCQTKMGGGDNIIQLPDN